MQFGTHFEIYEQHCSLEKLNLTNLNKAMLNPDFMAYLKVRTYAHYTNVPCIRYHASKQHS